MSAKGTSNIVPGAPPPASKSQKKKRRAGAGKADDGMSTPASASVGLPDTQAAALTEQAPTELDVQKGAVADVLVHNDKGEAPSAKLSPVAELLSKRLKNVGKKISRIESYSSKPTSELNEDQKKTLSTLPALEAVKKELEETKKAVEALEAEQAREVARARAEAEEAEKTRLLEELATSQAEHAVRTARVLDFIRLHSMLTASDPSIQALNLVEAEINAIFASVNALMAQESETKHEVLRGFLGGEGDIEGIAYTRLFEILDAYSNPPAQDGLVQPAEAVVDALIDSVPRPTVAQGLGPSAGTSLNFMAESELDDNPVAFDIGAEFVERRDVPQEPEQTILTVDVENVVVPVEPVAETPVDSGLNWAEDEGELPSIDGLHAAFGTSGTATPASAPAPVEPEQQTVPAVSAKAAPNGHATSAIDNDGFVTYRGGHRGRVRGGRGGQNSRGGHTGERGGFRGQGFRGRGRGKNSDGDWRGHEGDRGRGRGHRGLRGGRGGGGPPAPSEETKAV